MDKDKKNEFYVKMLRNKASSVGIWLVLGVMLVVVLYCFVTVDIEAMPYTSIVNLSVDTVGMLLGLLLYYSCYYDVEGKGRIGTSYLIVLILIDYFQLFNDVIAWTVQGSVRFRVINIVINTIYYIFTYVIILYYWKLIYVSSDSNRKVTSVFDVIVKVFALISIISVIFNIEYGFYFRVDESGFYSRTEGTYNFSGIAIVISLVLIVICVVISKNTLKEKITYLFSIIISAVFIHIQFLQFGLSFIYVIVMLNFMLIYVNVQLEKSRKYEKDKLKLAMNELELSRTNQQIAEQRAKILLSQMQPHFINNGMVAIRRLVKKKSDDALPALDYFSGFLCGSIDMFEEDGLIDIRREIEFTRNYLEIEKIRFGKNIDYEINLNCEAFALPPFIIQPIAENAIRHGIREKEDGRGKVTVDIDKTKDAYRIVICDDGIGFDIDEYNKLLVNNGKFNDANVNNADVSNARDNDAKVNGYHIGIKNVKERIEKQCQGRVEVDSKVGVGTKVGIYIPLQVNWEDANEGFDS